MDFFKLPHIFVVFPPGASGNFITSIIRNIVNKNFKELNFSVTGNAHPESINLNNDIACGLLYKHPYFTSYEEKLTYYKNLLFDKYNNNLNPQVGWTHDFTNIKLYKELFPNSKILIINCNSHKEKLISIILQELKNSCDPNGYVFIDDKKVRNMLDIIYNELKYFSLLYKIDVPDDISSLIVKNYFNPNYFEIFACARIIQMIELYGLVYLISNKPNKNIIDLTENCLYYPWFDDNYSLFVEIGPKYQDFITTDCVILPFKDIIQNSQNITSTLNRLFDFSFDETIEKYIVNSVNSYLEKQPKKVLENPQLYIQELYEIGYKKLKDLIDF